MAGPGYEPGTLKTTGDTTELKSADSCIHCSSGRFTFTSTFYFHIS